MKKEMLVSLDHFLQIFLAQRPLARRILFLQTLFQYLGRGLQVDDKIGRRQLLAEVVVVPIIGI